MRGHRDQIGSAFYRICALVGTDADAGLSFIFRFYGKLPFVANFWGHFTFCLVLYVTRMLHIRHWLSRNIKINASSAKTNPEKSRRFFTAALIADENVRDIMRMSIIPIVRGHDLYLSSAFFLSFFFLRAIHLTSCKNYYYWIADSGDSGRRVLHIRTKRKALAKWLRRIKAIAFIAHFRF